MVLPLILWGILGVIALVSTSWLFSNFSDFIGSLGLLGWFVVMVILYFILRKFTPFGSQIDSIINRIFGFIKGASSDTLKILTIVVIVALGLSFFGALTIVDGWNSCTTEEIEYAGLDWEVKGCPMGAVKHLQEVEGFEHDQDYEFIDNDLFLYSRTTGKGKSLERVKITATTTVPEEKTFDLKYKLDTNQGEAKISARVGLLDNVLDVSKDKYSPSEVGDLVDILASSPADRIRRMYDEGKLACSTTSPDGMRRYNSPHCYTINVLVQGEEKVTIPEGKTIVINLESWADEESYGTAELNIFTTPTATIPEQFDDDEEVIEELGLISNLNSSINNFFENLAEFFSGLWHRIKNLI